MKDNNGKTVMLRKYYVLECDTACEGDKEEFLGTTGDSVARLVARLSRTVSWEFSVIRSRDNRCVFRGHSLGEF